MSEEKQIKKEKRREVIVKLAMLYGLARVTRYEDLPRDVKAFYSHYQYEELLRPLICFEYEHEKISMTVLARKYRVTRRQIQYMIQKSNQIKKSTAK